MKPRFFASPALWRKWLAANHARADEILVGFYKRDSGKPSITWPESVDEALCYGWIDGIRRRIDDQRYSIRFTPRRPRSIWSVVNLKRATALVKERRMTAAGLRAFNARSRDRSGIYSFEQRKALTLSAADQARFKANPEAWRFFSALAPGYRRTAIFWVVSAKREETRRRRLTRLIEDAERHKPIGRLSPKKPG